MLNDVWLKIAQFLGTLNGENIKRESYVRTPEYEAALEAWKETEQEWEVFLETPACRRAREGRGNEGAPRRFCVCQGERADIDGYVDCVQGLYHMGLIKENVGMELANSNYFS